MNISTIVVLVLFLVLVALVVCYMWRKGPSCGCGSDCSRCHSCHSNNATKTLLLVAALLSQLVVAPVLHAQNPNERLAILMKDGTAYRLLCNKVAGLTAVKMDQQQHATQDYEGLLIATKDGQAALLPLADISVINHIKGEPTDGAYGATWYEIERRWNEHAEVVMLNAINNYNNGRGVITQEYDENWCGQREMFMVGFLPVCDLGYDVNFSVRGLDSGTDYTAISGFVIWLPQNAEGNTFGQGCWAFPMPPETVLITATATENTDYDEFPWLGNYTGYPIPLTDNFVYSATDASTTRLSLKGNKSYIFSSTADKNVTSSMEYTYSDGKFAYKPDESGDLSWRGDQLYYGLTGYWLTDDLIYLRADAINEDKPENTRRYFMLKDGHENFEVTIGARDNWNGRSTQYLAELCYDGQAHYYFMDNYGAGIYPATVEFSEGNTINGACDATVTYMDNTGMECQFRYLTEDGTNPQFLPAKKEEPDGPETAEWTGPNYFQNENAVGVYDGTERSNHRIYINIDKNLQGADNPGKCSLRVDFSKGYSYDSYAISTTGSYIYSPKEGTLTLKDMLVGIAGGGQTQTRDLVLRVSSDLKSIYLDPEACGERLYPSRTNTYLLTGTTNTLTAKE